MLRQVDGRRGPRPGGEPSQEERRHSSSETPRTPDECPEGSAGDGHDAERPRTPEPDFGQQPEYGQPQPGPQPRPSAKAVEAEGFFAALFDFSCRSVITIKFAKFVYALLIICAAMSWLFLIIGIIGGFTTGEPVVGILALLFGWIPAVFHIVLHRITLEVMISLVRTPQNTAATQAEVEQLRADLMNR